MQTSRSVAKRSVLGALAIFAATAVLAGCSGSQNQMSPAAPQTSAQSMQNSIMEPDACRHEGGVRVTPCVVTFTVSNPGPDTVTLKTPNSKNGSVVERDNCGGATGKATVTQGTGDTWVVTAGATAGTCGAHFIYFNKGKRAGAAVLTIHNEI